MSCFKKKFPQKISGYIAGIIIRREMGQSQRQTNKETQNQSAPTAIP
jgi:hypothetical protein